MIAWEALFGEREGELSFRIALSIALLLGVDRARRLELLKQAREIYSFRSAIVHGARARGNPETVAKASDAMRLGRLAIRALYEGPRDRLTNKRARTTEMFMGGR